MVTRGGPLKQARRRRGFNPEGSKPRAKGRTGAGPRIHNRAGLGGGVVVAVHAHRNPGNGAGGKSANENGCRGGRFNGKGHRGIGKASVPVLENGF